MENVQLGRQHAVTSACRMNISVGTKSVMEFASHRVCLATENVEMEPFYVDRFADKMVAIGEHATGGVFIRLKLVKENVLWIVLYVELAQDA